MFTYVFLENNFVVTADMLDHFVDGWPLSSLTTCAGLRPSRK